MNTLGYSKPLFILAFDHRSTFLKKMFNRDGPFTREITAKIKELKRIIYDGFLEVVPDKIPKEEGAILVDEQFGDEILRDAIGNGYAVALTTEKSGQEEFDFEYGNSFSEYIKKYKPTFVKALVHYNPERDQELNSRQRSKLKLLSDYTHSNGYKLLIELLIQAPTEEIKPKFMIQTISEFQTDGIEPDVWKIEGMENPASYKEVVQQARSNGRDRVGIVILGRGEDKERVEEWIKAGAPVPGVIGFAIGRTIFWEPVSSYYHGQIGKDEAITQIAHNYENFHTIFIQNKTSGI